MSRWTLRLFGTPEVERDGRVARLDRRKAEALLSVLVVEPHEHRRSELSLLLWPELSAASSRAALRRALFTLTTTLGRDVLDATRDTVGLSGAALPWSDVGAFSAAVRRSRDHAHGPTRACESCVLDLETAVRLHRNDFLSGLTLRDAPAFDAWQHRYAEHFRELRTRALEALVRFHFDRGALESAISWARAWTQQDPLDETSHEWLMRTLVASGRRGAALRLYDTFERRLDRELQIDPPSSMVRLARTATTPELIDAPADDGELARWRSACGRRDVEAMGRLLDGFHDDVDCHGLYRDGIDLLELGLGAMADDGPLFGRILARQGVLYSCIGQLEKARILVAAARRIARRADDELELAFCQNRLGCIAFAQGNYRRAQQLLHISVRGYRNVPSGGRLPWALNVWGHLSIGDASARTILVESLTRARRANDRQRIGSTLNSLGKESLSRRDFTSAERELVQSLDVRRDRDHRIGIADTLNNLGRTFLGQGRCDAARRTFEEGFEIARAIDARPMLAEILVGMSKFHRRAGAPERAAELASSALHLPGGWRDAKDDASTMLTGLARELTRGVLAAAVARGERLEGL